MCFDLDSAPTISRDRGRGGFAHDDLVLNAADGNELPRSCAAEEPSRRGIVILPDVRGRIASTRRLALRFRGGTRHVTLDYFGRTAAQRRPMTISVPAATWTRRRDDGCRPHACRG